MGITRCDVNRFAYRLKTANRFGVQAVVDDYKSLKNLITGGGGAVIGGAAGKKAAQEALEQATTRAARTAAKKAAGKVIVTGVLKGSGVGTVVGLAGDGATYVQGFSRGWSESGRILGGR